MANDNKILIFDTTLRDGEQSAGIGLTKFEKLEIATQLNKLNVERVRIFRLEPVSLDLNNVFIPHAHCKWIEIRKQQKKT